jgi:hypothetical protein
LHRFSSRFDRDRGSIRRQRASSQPETAPSVLPEWDPLKLATGPIDACHSHPVTDAVARG